MPRRNQAESRRSKARQQEHDDRNQFVLAGKVTAAFDPAACGGLGKGVYNSLHKNGAGYGDGFD
jgi:hypothetical protein